ncbi:hypothetical protein [Streptomyces lavendulae]|uniref:hypothetical protein n=1 Tax=Streptomyces lavendulae TaxID=1914 RepID=UPI0024A0ADF0|nr:hypothetical protein [Streptomyces lavendulae]GLW04796.1 hypothetical protein Slala05_84260 [Streptomyces lavendulae subsp. lavendulae]
MARHARALGDGAASPRPRGAAADELYMWHRSRRHTNTNKRLCEEIWDKGSGYTRNDRDVLSFFFYNAPPGEGPVKKSFAEIADQLEMKAITVGRCVRKLETGNLLLPTWKVGRTTFYRPNPLLNYDGASAQQRAAAFGVPVPLVPYPEVAG